MDNNTIKQYNQCIICKTKKELSDSKLCGDEICIKLFFSGVHKSTARYDNTLLLYLICKDSKIKNELEIRLKGMSIKARGSLMRRLKREHNNIYKANKQTLNQLR